MRAGATRTAATDYVFSTTTGKRFSTENVRNRVFAAAVERANLEREKLDLVPLPDGLTPHSLRRTYISALIALGKDVTVVMREVGHSDPHVTLGIYSQVMEQEPTARELLAALLEGRNKGTFGHWNAASADGGLDALAPETSESLTA